jgi:hypothetical protein
MPVAAKKTTRKTASKATSTSKTSTSKSTKVSTPNKSASETVKSLADKYKVNYRKARRIARQEGLGVGKGAKYDALTKPQVKKFEKALAASVK